MATYDVEAPNGKTYTVEGPSGAEHSDIFQAILAQHPEAGTARTFGGYAKEAVKGLGRGAVGFLESAGIGAAALLPEEVEKPVAAKIKELGDRFSPQAAPGYEDAIPTRLGEGLGSMLSTLAIPGGVVGRGLALGASGAGEARQRAQQESATPEQISSATAQGIAPGLVDLLPIQFLLGGAGKVALKGLVSRGARAATTGSIEGVTEAAQNIMQNAIAQGYKLDQGLYEGTGEAATYGGAVGAIAQGLLDLALPGRARRGQQPQRETAGAQPEVAPPEVQEPIAPEVPEAPEALTPTETPLAPEAPQAEPVKAAKAAAPVNAAAPAPEVKPGVITDGVIKDLGIKGYGSTKVKDTLLGVDLNTVEGQRTFDDTFASANKNLKYNADATQAFRASVPNLYEAPSNDQLNVADALKKPVKTTGVRPDGRGASDVQPISPDESGESSVAGTDVAGMGGAESTASEPTGGKKVLPDAIKVPYKEVSVKDEETSVKVFNEYKQDQKGTTTPGTLDLTDPTIRASQTAVTPARVEAFAKNADLSETLARLDKKEPILVTQVGGKNVIVDGHHRITAAKLTGLTEVPVHFLEAEVEAPEVEAKPEAPVQGKINKAKLKKKVAEPVQKTEVVAPEVIPPERLKRAADYLQMKGAPEAAKDYYDHYGSMDKSLEALGFDLAEKTKKGEMGYGKEGGVEKPKKGRAPAYEFANWIEKTGTPEQKVTLKKSQDEYAKLKSQAEDAVFVQRGVKQRDLEEAVREQLEREQRLAAETEFKQREREKANETETEAEADKADKDATAVSKTAEGVLQERATRKRKGEPIEKMETKADYERVIKEASENEPEFSRGKAAAPTGNTKENTTKALKNHFKEDARFDNLTTVVQSEADLPDEIRNSKDYRAGTRGVAYKNKVFLVADNIPQGKELGVFLHEAGAHIGFDNIMKPGDRQFLADQVRKWAKGKGDAVETIAAKAALEKGGKSNDEIIAYMTEELVNRGVSPTSFRPANTWLRRVVEAFKKVMNKLGLRQDIAPQELVDLAYGAAHIAMDTKVGQELAEFKRIATEVFDEPRFERGKATNWYKALYPAYYMDGKGGVSFTPSATWAIDPLPIGSFGPVKNASIRMEGYDAKDDNIAQIDLYVDDGDIAAKLRFGTPNFKSNVENFTLKYNREKNILQLYAEGIPSQSDAVEKYEGLFSVSDKSGYTYLKFNSGVVGNETVRTAIRTLRDKAFDLGYINKDTRLIFSRETGATVKTRGFRTLNYDQMMRFSQANPGMDAVDARTLGLVSGPSAPQSIVKQAYQTALNPRPEKFMQNLRQNFANKNTWWEDWFSSLHGNNALDTAGAASAIDRVQASTKIGGIQLATLDKGGFRKGANGLWEAYDTDASYKDIVEQISKMEGKYKAAPDFDSAQSMFNLAATAKREEGLMASGQTTDTGGGIKRTLDDAQLRQGLAVFNSTPEIQEALRLYKKFNDRNVDTLITAGIIDASLAAELKGNSGYVPWFRFMQDANGDINIKAVKGFSRGLINLSKMQDLEGGKIEDVQIGNILDNMAKLSNWMVGKSIGNDTSAFMVDFAIPYGQAKRVGLPTAGGVDAKKTVQIMRNGIPTYYEMSDPAALPAFKGYEAAHGAIVSVLAKPANILRKTITLNPVFSIAQLPQDSFRAFAASGLKNPYAIFPRVMKNFIKELYGRTDTGRELAKYGVVGKGSGMPTEASDNIRRQLGYYDKGAGGAWSRFTDGLERISSASDEAVRTALYELTLEEGGSQVLALRRAREIINFDTQGAGATSSFLRQTVPFMGVWMNDLNNLYKGLVLGSARLSEGERNATRAAIVYRGMQIAGLVTLYTLMVGDDDDYKKLDDDTRNRSLIVPGTGFRIPVPNDGIGFLFKVIPEEVTRAVMAQGIESDDAGAKMGRAIWNGFKNIGSFENLLPGAGSPLIKTPVELILNKSFYTGNPIVGKSKEFLAPAEQYTEGTSEIAKQLGAALNLSPIKLDYLVRGLTAQVGGSVLAASNALFHAADGKVTPSWSGDIKDIPLLGQLGYSRKDKGDLEDYYELRHTVDKVARTYRDMIASGRGKEAIEYLTDPTNQKAFALRQLQTQIDKGLAQYRNMEKLIYSNQSLDSDEMRRQLNRVEEMRTKYLQSLRLPKLRAFAEISPPLDSSAFRILR